MHRFNKVQLFKSVGVVASNRRNGLFRDTFAAQNEGWEQTLHCLDKNAVPYFPCLVHGDDTRSVGTVVLPLSF